MNILKKFSGAATGRHQFLHKVTRESRMEEMDFLLITTKHQKGRELWTKVICSLNTWEEFLVARWKTLRIRTPIHTSQVGEKSHLFVMGIPKMNRMDLSCLSIWFFLLLLFIHLSNLISVTMTKMSNPIDLFTPTDTFKMSLECIQCLRCHHRC